MTEQNPYHAPGGQELPPEVQQLVDEAREAGRKEAETTAAAAAAGRQQVSLPGPTHYLQLADGTTADGTGAIPTHVSVGEGDQERRIPVIHAYER